MSNPRGSDMTWFHCRTIATRLRIGFAADAALRLA